MPPLYNKTAHNRGMLSKRVTILKLVSVCFLVITVYLFAGNMAKCFQWRQLKSPFLPGYFTKKLSNFHLHIAFALISSVGISVLFYRYGRYDLAIASSLVVLLLVNYFPQLFG
jgi:hypothetical protein